MRRSLVLCLAFGLAACIPEAEPEPYVLRPVSSDPDSLLARLDARALDAAFDRLDAAGYRADVIVRDAMLGRPTSGDTLFATTIEVRGGRVRVLSQRGEPQGDAQRLAAFDPVARLLPEEPPFQNPAIRELYTTERLRLRDSSVAIVKADLSDESDPIRRVAASIDTTTGQVVEAQVIRASESAVYDELSNAYVRLRPLGGVWYPSEGELLSDVDVPLSDARRLTIAWRVRSVGGVDLAE